MTSEELLKLSTDIRNKASKLSCICSNEANASLLKNNKNIICTNKCKTCGHPGKQIDLRNTDLKITTEMISQTIRNLKKSPSSGCDGITVNHLFQALSEPLVKALSEIYSMIINTSTVPSIFETGIIIPIPKKSSQLQTMFPSILIQEELLVWT